MMTVPITPRLQRAVSETLDYLLTLVRDGTRPTEAKTRLHALRDHHPAIELDLVWQEEVYDGSLHYDALLRMAGEGTVSLSVCPERALPWPMRGVHRWSDAELAMVNDTVLLVDQAVACLDFI